jgi:hypothetical protein
VEKESRIVRPHSISTLLRDLYHLREVIYFDLGSEFDPSILQGMSCHVVGTASFNSA